MQVDHGGSPTPLPGMLLADPANADCPSCLALTYLLPESVLTGDVSIFDPVSEGGGVSSWLRFTDDSGDIAGDAAGTGVRMIFYADVPFPDNIGTVNSLPGPTKMINADGTSSFDYQPAGVPFDQNNEYIGVIGRTTTVPEPGSLALLGSCVVAMGLIAYRRRQRD